MASVLEDFVGTLEGFGIYEVALPFLLIFTLAFAVLEKSKILGDKKRPLNVIISVVLALFFIRNTYLVALINRFLPNVSLFMVIMLMTILLLGIVYGGEVKGFKGSFFGIGAVLSVIFIIWSLSSDFVGRSGLDLPRWLYDITPETRGLIIFIGAFVFIIWWATKEEKKEKNDNKKFLQNVREDNFV